MSRARSLGNGQTAPVSNQPEKDPKWYSRETDSGLLIASQARPVGFTGGDVEQWHLEDLSSTQARV